jgi:hypothetical protein
VIYTKNKNNIKIQVVIKTTPIYFADIEDGLEKKAADTAEFLLFMDTLFDSLNGHNQSVP